MPVNTRPGLSAAPATPTGKFLDVGVFEKSLTTPDHNAMVMNSVMRFLADLNGSEWIKPVGPGEIDMIQRGAALHMLVADILLRRGLDVSVDLGRLREMLAYEHEINLKLQEALLAVTSHTGKSVDVGSAQNEATTPDDELSPIEVCLIGSDDNGIDGKDDYILLKRKGDVLTPEQAKHWLEQRYYKQSSRPGGHFCTDFRVMQIQYSESEVVGIVCHRWDV